jgi:hypothetical protein
VTKRTHQTAPTRLVESDGIRFAYRDLEEIKVSRWFFSST